MSTDNENDNSLDDSPLIDGIHGIFITLNFS